ncbi:DUF2577 domain-containing protein [Lachnospiraceae bacterium JLR.KK008]
MDLLSDANGIIEKIKRAALEAQDAAKPVNICYGEVISRIPLKIRVEQKLLLGEKQLILTRNVTDFTTTISVDQETEKEAMAEEGGESVPPHSHRITGVKQITVHNGLKAGDKVVMLRQQEGQKFIVADRIGGSL